jgi:hypothetical protein
MGERENKKQAIEVLSLMNLEKMLKYLFGIVVGVFCYNKQLGFPVLSLFLRMACVNYLKNCVISLFQLYL